MSLNLSTETYTILDLPHQDLVGTALYVQSEHDIWIRLSGEEPQHKFSKGDILLVVSMDINETTCMVGVVHDSTIYYFAYNLEYSKGIANKKLAFDFAFHYNIAGRYRIVRQERDV